MADPGLRRSSLDHRADDFRQACAADLSIRELTFQAQTILRGDPDDPGFRTGCAGILGCALPRAPNTVGARGSLTVLWLGPDEWLIVGPDGSGDPIRAGLRDALAGLHAAVVDMDAARTVIELHGGSGTAVLESVCVLDLHPRVFPPGGCAQTMI
ncbi:MAG: sarcosine oxidase subunit gamma, partial [Alphaproteobacteria bacterium]